MATNETLASSPASPTGPNTGLKAPKDRACPFCGQAFTSSSLGRHLDLYIKPKNPKPADGIHDVDEIRKLRGGITRRQPRSSLKASNNNAARAGSDGPPSSVPSKVARSGTVLSEDSPVASPVPLKENDRPRTTFNAPNWLATGVINNLPPRSSSRGEAPTPLSDQAQRMQEMRRDTEGNKILRPDYESESMSKLQEAAELGRAAEMALREVLGSLQAARNSSEPQKLFPATDFFGLSFPGLCLALLPAPGTLFSPTPFPSADSWSLGPPGSKQYEALNRCVMERMSQQNKTNPLPDSVYFKYHTHLSGAWEHWETLPDNERASAWNLEILRSFQRSQDQSSGLRQELEVAHQRIRHLEAEYDRLSRCQLPREYLMHPPNTVPIEPSVMKAAEPLNSQSEAAAVNYDANALISKWRTTIRATSRPPRTASLTYQNGAMNKEPPKKSDLREEMVMNGSVWGVGGPMARNTQHHLEGTASRDQAGIAYETPPQPGQVINADDGDDDTDDDADADGDAEEDVNNQSAIRGKNAGAMMQQGRNRPQNRTERSPMAITGMLNANGKRTLPPSAATGRPSKGYRVSEPEAVQP